MEKNGDQSPKVEWVERLDAAVTCCWKPRYQSLRARLDGLKQRSETGDHAS